MSLRIDHPELLWLLLLAAPVAWLGIKRLNTLEDSRKWIAIAMRCVVLLLIVLMIAGLRAQRRHTDLTVIAVVDQSASMRVFGQPPPVTTTGNGNATLHPESPVGTVGLAVRDWLTVAATAERQADDKLGLVTYDAQPTVALRPGNSTPLSEATVGLVREGTDTATAIEWATAAKSDADTALRLVLVSDGNDTTGDALAAARAAAAAGVVIDVLPIKYKVGNEVMVEGVYTPNEAREGQTVAVRVVLRATSPSSGRLQLRHDGDVLDINGQDAGTGLPITPSQWSDATAFDAANAEIASEDDGTPATYSGSDASGRYLLVKQVDVPIRMAGANRFEAVFEPSQLSGTGSSATSSARNNDSELVNNRAESFTLVQGQGRVLLVDNERGASGSVLPTALRQRQIELDVIPSEAFPTGLTELSRYDAVILQNVPSESLTGRQQTMLARYVNDLGGGFAMLGGPDSFGAGGWTNSLIDRTILPVACEIPSQTVMPSGAVAIVVDRSGSMGMPVGNSGQTQLELASEAAVLMLNTLYEHDLIGVVAFDSSGQWVVPIQPAGNKAQIAAQLRSLEPGGGTVIIAGLDRAYDGLTAPENAIQESSLRHIILLTDGGSSGDYEPILNKLNRANITMSTVGVGDGHDKMLLEALAFKGGGEYHPIDNPKNLPEVFIKEARTIRRNLIKEQPFTPRRVNTGSPIMTGITSMPNLQGLVLTGPKYDRRIYMPLTGPDGEPLFAHWQVGLGKAAAFTSDATNRWATDWLNWGGYSDFWARTVRYISRPSASREAELTASVDGDTLKIRLDAPPNVDPSNLTIKGKLLAPGGDNPIVDVDLKATGPGVYEASVPADRTGSYILNLFMADRSGKSEPQFIAGGATKVPGAELRRFTTNDALLKEIAAVTGGRVLDATRPAEAGLFSREHRFESVSSRPLRWMILPWLLAFLLIDVANRRIAWDAKEIAAWGKSLMTIQRRTAEQTQGTMSALKKRRTAAVESHGQSPSNQPDDTENQPATSRLRKRKAADPAPAKNRKFEAKPGSAPSADFASAVGGATESADRPTLKPKDKTDDSPDTPAPTTSRHLDAKRRARERGE